MTASTRMAQNRLAPSGRWKATRTAGTKTIMPMRPYTTDGMPASRSTAGRTRLARRRRYLGQEHCGHEAHRYAQDNGPGGAVDGGKDEGQYAELGLGGGGGPLGAEEEVHQPISRMAGRPDTIR